MYVFYVLETDLRGCKRHIFIDVYVYYCICARDRPDRGCIKHISEIIGN